MKIRYRCIVAPQTAVWACFEVTDSEGCPGIYKGRVVFWGLTNDGEPVGLVIGTKSGLLEPARRFSNFVRYEYAKDSEQCVPFNSSETR